ncbi:unnamed protein product [Colias eurytheme]|nr:unnamed protein product [Colias eurytheme]
MVIILIITTQSQSNNVTTESGITFSNTTTASWSNWSFKDYLNKFNPTHVWEEISKENAKKGIKNTLGDEFESIFKSIDQTDELLSLKVPKGDPKLILKDGRRWEPTNDTFVKMLQDGRRWEPPGGSVAYTYDRFSLNRRFIELMKQAIYQARNKMAIMQELRSRYNQNSLYKMGFLMSKTDQACKTFARFTTKAFMSCFHTRLKHSRWPLLEILEAYERVINLWFDVELLVDLILLNDVNCERMLNQVLTNRKEAWKFVD